MASLKNKNKKRGFKDAFHAPIPSKIVFADGDNSKTSSIPHESGSEGGDVSSIALLVTGAKPGAPRLVPPSERYALGLLPQNVVVTSVDVGDDFSKKCKRQRLRNDESFGTYYDEHREEAGRQIQSAQNVDMVTAEDEEQQQVMSGTSWEHLYSDAEIKWETLITLTERMQIEPGCHVVWKASILTTPLPLTCSLTHSSRP
jgi:hypothetical protein